MTDEYKRFVRQLKAASVGMTFEELSDRLMVAPTSVRAYFNFTHVMSTETMLRAIRIMGGYSC